MANRPYDNQSFDAVHVLPLSGNDRTTDLLTPQAGTAAETKTHTTTLKPFPVLRNIILKKIAYIVDTAQTGTGCNLALDIYKGTTSVGSLSVTTEAALAIATSSDIDSNFVDTDYLRIIAKSTTTASAANAAVGQVFVTYQERYV